MQSVRRFRTWHYHALTCLPRCQSWKGNEAGWWGKSCPSQWDISSTVKHTPNLKFLTFFIFVQNSSYDKLVEDLTSEMLQYETPGMLVPILSKTHWREPIIAPTQEASTTSNDRNSSMTSTCSNASSTTCAAKSVDTVATTVAGSKSSLGKRFSSDTSVIANKRPLKAVKTGVTSFQEPVYVVRGAMGCLLTIPLIIYCLGIFQAPPAPLWC